jgi:hypothetical protein
VNANETIANRPNDQRPPHQTKQSATEDKADNKPKKKSFFGL